MDEDGCRWRNLGGVAAGHAKRRITEVTTWRTRWMCKLYIVYITMLASSKRLLLHGMMVFFSLDFTLSHMTTESLPVISGQARWELHSYHQLSILTYWLGFRHLLDSCWTKVELYFEVYGLAKYLHLQSCIVLARTVGAQPSIRTDFFDFGILKSFGCERLPTANGTNREWKF